MTESDFSAGAGSGKVKKGWEFERISSWSLFILVFLLPIFFVPNLAFPLQFSKAFLLFALTFVAFCIWVVARLKDGRFVVPSSPMLVALLAVVSISTLSGLFSGSIVSSLLGQGFEIGTALNIVILSVLAFLVPVMFRTKEQIFWSYIAFLASFVLLSLFHVLRLALGANFLSLGIFTDVISNTVGKWNDLGIFFGVSTLLSLVTIEFLSFGRVLKTLVYLILALSLFFLAVVNFSTIWFVLGLFSLVFLVYTLSFRHSKAQDSVGDGETATIPQRVRPLRRISVPSLAVLFVSIVFIFAGDSLGNRIGTAFGISQIEVRPSWSATFEVSRETLAKDPLLGSGPNQFASEWLKYKPDGINSTVFWNTDFNYGVGLIPTFLLTTGILGALAWVAFFLAFLYTGFKAILSDFSDRLSEYLVTSSFFISLFLWIFAAVYIPSLAIFALAFIFTGLFIASLAIVNKAPLKVISFANDPRSGFVSVLVLILLLIGGVTLGYDVTQKYVASVLFQKGVISFNTEGSIDKSEGLIARAAALAPTDLYYRFLAELSLMRMSGILRSDSAKESAESVRTKFQNLLGAAILNARQAVAQNPKNYENHVILGRVYEAVVPLKIDGSYAAARAAYTEALVLNPRSPLIHLAIARLEVAKGDNAKARESIALALREKNNYTEAIFFLSQIEAQEGNIKAAIASVEAASVIAPGDASIFFQLGILRFNDKDFRGAASALERAVEINPSYANARYFLGLSYEKLGRDADAVTQFKELKVTNPDNKEVDLILGNLTAGRDPFTNAAPPVDSTPEKRSKLPVDENKAAIPQDEE